MTDVLFPEWEKDHPAPVRKPRPPFVMKPQHKMVLTLLEHHGIMSERIVRQELVGQISTDQCERAIDDLAKQGYIADSGQRGEWTKRAGKISRAILWRFVKA